MKFLTPLIILGLAIAIFFWYIDPTYREAQDLANQSSQYDQQLANAVSASKARDTLIARYKSITDDEQKRLTTALPDNVDQIQAVVNLQSLAQKYGAQVAVNTVPDYPSQNAKPTAVSDSSAVYKVVPITFTVSLTYPNFLNFLRDVEHSLAIADVSQVDFMAKGSDIYDFAFTVNYYALK